jgi:hypothetical protein
MAGSSGWIGRLEEAVEKRTGRTVVDSNYVDRLEEAAKSGRALARELDMLGWSVMDFLSGNPQELTLTERRKLAQAARVVWASDPQAGAAVDLSNDFVFGRGVTPPKFKDHTAQEIIDEAWSDPDNQLVLTSFESQVALNTDLELQSNIFLLMFDDGEDGKVKLGLLNHDDVRNVVRDPDNRLRILYYLAAHTRQEWDYDNDRPKVTTQLDRDGRKRMRYYQHWANIALAETEGRQLDKPPEEKMGEGKVRHIAVNRTTEMAFGVPTMRRTIRWFTAYNDFMKARVDMAQAAAAFIMKSSSRSTPGQLAKLAGKAISRAGDPAQGADGGIGQVAGPGGAANILRESDSLKHENMALNSGAGNATQDGQMLRSQISAATHFPQHYLGDAGSANLATATSMELPVLKHVESRQEVWEGVFRWFIDRVIEKAVEDGRLDRYEDPAEVVDGQVVDPQAQIGPGDYAPDLGAPAGPPQPGSPAFGRMQQGGAGKGSSSFRESYEDQAVDEQRTERDLSYEFSMPNPLKRTMLDLVNAVSTIAKTFDPNNTNPELSRVLLAVVLGEGLELDDVPGAVDTILPEGYVDPAVAAAQQAAAAMAQGAPGPGGVPTGPGGPPGAPGADGQRHGQANPYGAPMKAGPPMQQAALLEAFAAMPNDALVDLQMRLPDEHPLREQLHSVSEARFRDLSEVLQLRSRGRVTQAEEDFNARVGQTVSEVLAGLALNGHGMNGMNGSNGNNNG